MHKRDFAIIILAAGSSARLGHPKQLVVFENESLLKRSVQQALQLSSHVFVVLGHEHQACMSAISDLPVQILFNQNYAKGMGNSLSFGISHTVSFSQTLIMLCDQPFIPLSHYQALLDVTCKDLIVASLYELEQKKAVPALFPQKYYMDLMKLDADKGAQALLKEEKCLHVTLESMYTIDIDTPEDVEKHLRKSS